MAGAFVCFLLAGSLCVADARKLRSVETAAKGADVISPSLDKSDKKFFGKDFPGDKRPKVDVLHFKHPYPVVQDSNDFDSDYVKDENSDNGHWRAQTEYDRLRHKLLKEKGDVAKALKAKDKAESELKDAVVREKVAEENKKKKAEEAEQDKKKADEEEEKTKKQGAAAGSKGKEAGSQEKKKQSPVTDAVTPEADPYQSGVKVGTGDTEKAIDALDECKKQLAEARQKLKDIMEKLEEAKLEAKETQAAFDDAKDRSDKLKAGEATVDKASANDKQEYLDAKAAYEKQQAAVTEMESEIKVAAEKVKAIRDAEDKDGGVYNTPKSGVAPTSSALFALVVIALASA